MPAWFTATHLADFVIAVTLAEGIGLLAWHAFAGRGLPPRAILILLAPGLCLMLALRVSVSGGPVEGVAALLALAGILHLADLSARWPRR